MVHQPVSRGLAVFADDWLSSWLAEISADLREDGSALEVVLHDYALYKSTFTLLYFTLQPNGREPLEKLRVMENYCFWAKVQQ